MKYFKKCLAATLVFAVSSSIGVTSIRAQELQSSNNYNTESVSETREVPSELTINVVDIDGNIITQTNSNEQFFIKGTALYNGGEAPEPSILSISIYNKETEVEVVEYLDVAEIVDGEYTYGPVTIPSTYDDGVYEVTAHFVDLSGRFPELIKMALTEINFVNNTQEEPGESTELTVGVVNSDGSALTQVNENEQFFIEGVASFDGRIPNNLRLAIRIFNKETEEVVVEYTDSAEITDETYTYGPVSIPSSCANGVYVVTTQLINGQGESIEVINTMSMEIDFVNNTQELPNDGTQPVVSILDYDENSFNNMDMKVVALVENDELNKFTNKVMLEIIDPSSKSPISFMDYSLRTPIETKKMVSSAAYNYVFFEPFRFLPNQEQGRYIYRITVLDKSGTKLSITELPFNYDTVSLTAEIQDTINSNIFSISGSLIKSLPNGKYDQIKVVVTEKATSRTVIEKSQGINNNQFLLKNLKLPKNANAGEYSVKISYVVNYFTEVVAFEQDFTFEK